MVMASGGLALVTLVAATVFAAGLAWPTSTMGELGGLSWANEARAGALISQPDPSPAVQREASARTRQSLKGDPANATAWLRLAYIDSLKPDGLGTTGLAALSRSYSLAPYGPDDSRWRLEFVFNNWSRMTPELRADALKELEVLALHRRYGDFPARIQDPIGRLAATLMLGPITARKAQLRQLERAREHDAARSRRGAEL